MKKFMKINIVLLAVFLAGSVNMMGNEKAYDVLKVNYKDNFFPQNGNAGVFYLHPNIKGAKILGNLWGESTVRLLKSLKSASKKL